MSTCLAGFRREIVFSRGAPLFIYVAYYFGFSVSPLRGGAVRLSSKYVKILMQRQCNAKIEFWPMTFDQFQEGGSNYLGMALSIY